MIRFGRGAGADSVTLTRYAGDVGSDTIAFGEGVGPEQSLLRNGPGNALIVELAGSPDILTLNSDSGAPYGRDRLRFQFADGSTWDAAEIAQHIRSLGVIEGGTGNDALTGSDGDDLFIGGEGNDTLTGGGGRDSFLFYRGDGTDSVIDEAPHIVFGEGIVPGDVTLSGSNFHLRPEQSVPHGGGRRRPGDRPQLVSHRRSTARSSSPTAPSGTRPTSARAFPYAFVSSDPGTFIGTPGNDSYALGASADTMRGHAGDDTLSAGAGNDSLQGDAGNDLLYGGEGDDSLAGGEGDDLLDAGVDALAPGESDADTLSGGPGNDVLIGRLGRGHPLGRRRRRRARRRRRRRPVVRRRGRRHSRRRRGRRPPVRRPGLGHLLVRHRLGRRQRWSISTPPETRSTRCAWAAASFPPTCPSSGAGLDLVLRLAPSGDSLAIRSSGRSGYGVERVVVRRRQRMGRGGAAGPRIARGGDAARGRAGRDGSG